jgi:hypothetical protein
MEYRGLSVAAVQDVLDRSVGTDTGVAWHWVVPPSYEKHVPRAFEQVAPKREGAEGLPLFVLGGLLLLVLAFLVLLPITLIQRYRVGTARQRARGWLIAVNMVGIVLSCAFFLVGAAASSFWIPNAFAYSVLGMGVGCLLGALGLLLTRWEPSVRDLHYTPSRVLVLLITVIVSARLAYGVWRAWHSWSAAAGGSDWIIRSGAAESLGVGAVVLGYYLIYWAGVRRRFRRHANRPLRPM